MLNILILYWGSTHDYVYQGALQQRYISDRQIQDINTYDRRW